MGRRVRERYPVLQSDALKSDDVFSEGEIFGLDGFVGGVQGIVFPHLVLQSLDMALLSLSECTLLDEKQSQLGVGQAI